MKRTYKYRLYPTSLQEQKILWTHGCVRYMYNTLLSERTKQYRRQRKWVRLDYTKVLQKAPFLKDADPTALKLAQVQLAKAFRAFRYREQNEPDEYRPECVEKNRKDPSYILMDTDLKGYPKYKRKKTSTICYTTTGARLLLSDKRVDLPGVGAVKIKLHRQVPKNAKILEYTVCKKASGKYYLLLLLHMEQEDIGNSVKPKKAIGVAFQPGVPVVRSDCVPVFFPKQEKQIEEKLRDVSQSLKRKVPGSKRYKQQSEYLASIYEKRTNQRKDAFHKASRQITNAGDVIIAMRPEVKNRLARMEDPDLRRQQLDEAWWTFSDMLQYKAAEQGKRYGTVVESVPVYQFCSACGHLKEKRPTGPLWHCTKCGALLPAALNAAKNLEAIGWDYIRQENETVKT